MQTELERRRLEEFVDRTAEMGRFYQMLESDEKHIMVVWGDEGMGKTSLRMRMVHECAIRSLRKAEVECGGVRTNTYLAVMRKIRDDVGLEHFNPFTEYANYLTDPNYPPISVNINVQGGVAVADQAHISGSSTGDIAAVVVKDNMFSWPRPELEVPEDESSMKLTDRFIDGLQAALKPGPVVVFLDSVEKLSSTTERWLWEELLTAVRDGRLPGIKCVLCAQAKPFRLDDRDWRTLIEEAELAPLDAEHIEAYLAKRGVGEAGRDNLALVLLLQTKGKVSEIAVLVDALLTLRQQMGKG